MPNPANIVLAHPNWIDANPRFATVSFSGGGWAPEMSLSHLLLPRLFYVARSLDVTLDSTRFWVDLGRLRDTTVIAIPWLRGYLDEVQVAPPKSTRIRWRAYGAIGGAVLDGSDTGWQDLCPVTYPAGTLPVWHPSFVDGKMTDEEWDHLHAAGGGMPFWHLYPGPVIARYWLCEIDVASSGYDAIDIPRVVIAPGWQSSLNFVYGASLGWEDPTIIEESMGGAEFFEELDGRMVFRFGFDHLPEDEMLIRVRDMQVMLRKAGQLFAILHPKDTVHRHRRAMLCRMRELPPIEYAEFGRDRATFELIQIIA